MIVNVVAYFYATKPFYLTADMVLLLICTHLLAVQFQCHPLGGRSARLLGRCLLLRGLLRCLLRFLLRILTLSHFKITFP